MLYKYSSSYKQLILNEIEMCNKLNTFINESIRVGYTHKKFSFYLSYSGRFRFTIKLNKIQSLSTGKKPFIES